MAVRAALTGILLLASVAGAPANAGAQAARPRWTFGIGLGPTRIDDLAGTPVTPSVSLDRAIGSRGLVGARLGLVHDAGFYSMDGVTLDVGVGVRSRSGRSEVSVVAGPSAILGGDSDGTPYLSVGPQASILATAWPRPRIGLQGGGMARLWFNGDGAVFAPALVVGIALRR